MNVPEFILDGIILPAPTKDGVEITPNHIWSSNAGRNSSTGLFVGDIIATKYTVKLTYEILNQSQMQTIWNAISGLSPWHSFTFPLYDGTIKTITCYVADTSYTFRKFDMQELKPYFGGVTVELIEQ